MVLPALPLPDALLTGDQFSVSDSESATAPADVSFKSAPPPPKAPGPPDKGLKGPMLLDFR